MTSELVALTVEERISLRAIAIRRGDREHPRKTAGSNGFRDEPRLVDRQLNGIGR